MSLCGTVQYLAPEIALGNNYTEAVDWWSFGIILYEMIWGDLPFEHKDKSRMMRMIAYQDLKFKKWFSKESKDLISKLLEKDPINRIGSNGAEEIMCHPFFKDINWDEIDKVDYPFSNKKFNMKGDNKLTRIDDNNYTEPLFNTPKGYKKFWYGESPKSSVISEKGSEENDIIGFTYIEEDPFERLNTLSKAHATC